MIITNAMVYGNGEFAPGEIYIEDGRFCSHGAGDTLDAAGMYAIPGLIDIHFHGCAGVEFPSATHRGMAQIARYQAQNGITAICPATLTLPEWQLEQACTRAAGLKIEADMADMVGIYLEGPFISPQKPGAQNPDYIAAPDAAMIKRLMSAAKGLVKVVTIAPEVPGAIELADELSCQLTISIAHTAAGYAQAKQAFDSGAGLVTHMFNAMNPPMGREPGVVGAAAESTCMVELICDGVHLHPATVRAMFRLFGQHRIVLVSDSMEATGLGDGRYSIGGLPVNVQGNEARLEAGSIAGSVTNLMGCLRWAVSIGIPFGQAVRCATENPAKAIGVFDSRGSIETGKVADVLLLDADLGLRQVIMRGRPLDIGR